MSDKGTKGNVGRCTCQKWAIPEIRGTRRRKTYFKLKIWEFPGSNFDLKKMGILKIVLKMGIPNFLVKNSKKWEVPFFVLKMIEDFGNSHVFFTLATKKVLNFGGFPNEKCG